MHFLIRLLTVGFIFWVVCFFFYSLGRKNALKNHEKEPDGRQKRKKVDSKVVEKKPDE